MIEIERYYMLLHPRPAYVIGSGKWSEKINFMAASWVSPIAEEPPLVGVAIDVESYTHELIERYQQYTINVVDKRHINRIYAVGSVSGREFDKTKVFIPAKGSLIDAPIVKDAIGVLECVVENNVEAEDVTLFIGRVVRAAADPHYFNKRKGWNVADNPIPLHNWGRGFYTVGMFKIADKNKP